MICVIALAIAWQKWFPYIDWHRLWVMTRLTLPCSISVALSKIYSRMWRKSHGHNVYFIVAIGYVRRLELSRVEEKSMTTVLFVHGINVRRPQYEKDFLWVKRELQNRMPTLKVEPCLWG